MSLRNVEHVNRSCEKLGCKVPAEVAFGIDRVACVVWLENYDADEQRHLNRLCGEHATRLTLPRGWSFDDRREKSPRLFVASKPAVAIVKPASKPARKTSNKTTALPRRTSRDASAPVKRRDDLGLFDPTLPMNSPLLTPRPTPVAAQPTPVVQQDAERDAAPQYAPKFDRTSDVGGALNARGRLLARAFSSQTKPIERPAQAANTDSLPQGDHIDDFNQGDHVE